MHGQKKRRKRTREGVIGVEGFALRWELLSEPQLTTEGFRGLRFSVALQDARCRELILEYPFFRADRAGKQQIPQRPRFTEKSLEADIRRAIESGWNPESRGKAYIFYTSESDVVS